MSGIDEKLVTIIENAFVKTYVRVSEYLFPSFSFKKLFLTATLRE